MVAVGNSTVEFIPGIAATCVKICVVWRITRFVGLPKHGVRLREIRVCPRNIRASD